MFESNFKIRLRTKGSKPNSGSGGLGEMVIGNAQFWDDLENNCLAWWQANDAYDVNSRLSVRSQSILQINNRALLYWPSIYIVFDAVTNLEII